MDSQAQFNVTSDTTSKMAGVLVVGALLALVFLRKLSISISA